MQADKSRISDDRISLVVLACLRHGIHHSEAFESSIVTSRAGIGYRERIGKILNGMSQQTARAELLATLQSVCGGVASHSASDLGLPGVVGAVGGAIRQQAESVGQLLEQGAGQVRDRLGSSRR